MQTVCDFMLSKCECGPNEKEICYCTVWTRHYIEEFSTVHFVDARLIASDEVFFKT